MPNMKHKSSCHCGRVANISQRRWVSLKGCVRRKEQAKALEQLVRRLDDVEAVINQLVVR
jgi:osmotically-inducible protein OsmY